MSIVKEAKPTDNPSLENIKKARILVRELIQESNNPPTQPGLVTWDSEKLAMWYSKCQIISMYLGKGNAWETILCSWDPAKNAADVAEFHSAILGTLISIDHFLKTMIQLDTSVEHNTLALLMPNGAKPVGEDSIVIGTPEWDTLTDRRAELIHKKNREGLNDDERTEYERLQQVSRTALARAFPRSQLSSEAKLSELEGILGSTEDRTDK
jgi:hypothetical protein